MTRKAGFKHTRKQGRPYKHLTCSYDDSADRTFSMAGRIMLEAESMPFADRLKALQVCLPLAMKRIPDKHETLNMTLSIDEATAKGLLERAERNSLIYKRLRDTSNPPIIEAEPGQATSNEK